MKLFKLTQLSHARKSHAEGAEGQSFINDQLSMINDQLALRLGCGKHAEGTACSASAGARRVSYAFVDIGALKHDELIQAKLE